MLGVRQVSAPVGRPAQAVPEPRRTPVAPVPGAPAAPELCRPPAEPEPRRASGVPAASVAPAAPGASGLRRLDIARGLYVTWGTLAPERAQGPMRLVGGSVRAVHVRAGRCALGLPDGSRVDASEGDVVLLGASVESVAVELRHGPATGLALAVDGRRLPADLRRALASLEVNVEAIARMVPPERPVLLVRPTPELARALADAYPLVEEGSLCHVRLKVAELLLCLSGAVAAAGVPACAGPGPARTPAGAPGGPARLRHLRIALLAQQEMLRDVSRPKTIPTLAAACGTSPTVLKESFREAFGVPIYTWYREYRVRLAADALLAGDLPVSEVAASVGYSNPSKFAKAFQDTMGTTPREWRAMRGVVRDAGRAATCGAVHDAGRVAACDVSGPGAGRDAAGRGAGGR